MASQPTQPGHTPQPAQKTSATPPKTVRAPRFHGGEPIEEQEKSPIADDFRKPLKRVGFVMGILFATVLLGSFSYQVISGLFKGAAPSSTTISSPLPNAKTTPENDHNACQGIPAKMKAAQVSGKQVDKAFLQKHPDRANKPLDLSAAADRPLRQEWCQIAAELASHK